MDEEKIVNEAKKIMDDFMTALDKVNASEESFGSERDLNIREASESEYGKDFKEKILKNAPNKDQDFIIAEKKTW